MRLNELSSKTSQWFSAEAPLSDIVISSRIRLARNLAGHKFISRCSDDEKQEILNTLKETILSLKMLGNIFGFIALKRPNKVPSHLLAVFGKQGNLIDTLLNIVLAELH